MSSTASDQARAASFTRRKGIIVDALLAAKGGYVPVADLCRAAYGTADGPALASTKSLVNEVRSTLRTNGVAASVLSTGSGETLRYAWSDGVRMDEQRDGQPRPAGVTLAPVGCTSCYFDGDSLVKDGVKHERARPA